MPRRARRWQRRQALAAVNSGNRQEDRSFTNRIRLWGLGYELGILKSLTCCLAKKKKKKISY